jgi:hypothetical protein
VGMLRYQCPRCHEITYRDEPTVSCGICFAPLGERDRLPDPEPAAADAANGRSLADLLNARDEARAAARAAYSL